jgi:hypothetical protein
MGQRTEEDLLAGVLVEPLLLRKLLGIPDKVDQFPVRGKIAHTGIGCCPFGSGKIRRQLFARRKEVHVGIMAQAEDGPF